MLRTSRHVIPYYRHDCWLRVYGTRYGTRNFRTELKWTVNIIGDVACAVRFYLTPSCGFRLRVCLRCNSSKRFPHASEAVFPTCVFSDCCVCQLRIIHEVSKLWAHERLLFMPRACRSVVVLTVPLYNREYVARD